MAQGTDLARRYFEEAVRPIIEQGAAGVGHLAARLGSGSDVVGLDDETSQDHDFGCRLTLLLDEEHAGLVDGIRESLEAGLPQTFEGWPVRFATSWDATVSHKVEVATVSGFASSRLGLDPSGPLAAADWLCLTGQSVLEVIGGPVFHDSTAEYSELVERLAWYPHDVWLYVLSSAWARLSQELPFVGRTAALGDTVGSQILAARLCRDMIHLAFLLERRWIPYPKWAGTVLRDLPTGPTLTGCLEEALAARDGQARQEQLAEAIECLGRRQADLGLPSVCPAVQPFFDRASCITTAGIHTLLSEAVEDPDVRQLPMGLGSIEQWSDNVDLLSWSRRRAAATGLYRLLIESGQARR